MKKLSVIVVFLVVSTVLYGQTNLVDKKWRSSSALFEDTSIDSYIFKPIEESLEWSDRWGYFLEFKNDGSFRTYYSAPCGLDCFTSVTGSYVLNGNVLTLNVVEIIRNNICPKEGEAVNRGEECYEVVFSTFKEQDSLMFNKISCKG